MSNEPIVNLYPDDPARPTQWTSEDGGSPTIVLQRHGDSWRAKFGRRAVAEAGSAEALTAHLFAEHGLLAVLHEHGVPA